MLGEPLEAGVRVDPPLPGLRDRRAFVERQARGVGEQVPDSRAGRACGLVEVDDSLLGGDQGRERGRELCHRSPAKDPVAWPVRARDLALPKHSDRDRLRGPVLHLPQGVHRERY